MRSGQNKDQIKKRRALVIPVILVFCILCMAVFWISRKTTEEMSASAIGNLNESLNLVQGTIETILQKEAEFQKLIADELIIEDNMERFILSYKKIRQW